jgi:hypothetical protein
MWTAENRGNYERGATRYPSDVTDEKRALIEPHLTPERNSCQRQILNAVLYVLTIRCHSAPPDKAFERADPWGARP